MYGSAGGEIELLHSSAKTYACPWIGYHSKHTGHVNGFTYSSAAQCGCLDWISETMTLVQMNYDQSHCCLLCGTRSRLADNIPRPFAPS